MVSQALNDDRIYWEVSGKQIHKNWNQSGIKPNPLRGGDGKPRVSTVGGGSRVAPRRLIR